MLNTPNNLLYATPEEAGAEREAALSPEEADALVSSVLEIHPGNPEALVRLLLALDMFETSLPVQMSLDHLVTAAYIRSEAHTITRQAYLEAVREGRDPAREARQRFESEDLAERLRPGKGSP